MKWTVEVGAGICDHLNFADLKLSTGCIVRLRIFARQMVGDNRSREPLISNHPVFYRVTDVN
jgi:hypothetical protein